MAGCTIGEYPSGALNGMQLVAGAKRITTQNLSVGGGSVVSQPFGPTTKCIRVWTDSKQAFRHGAANAAPPTALPTDEGMSAGQTEYFVVEPGDYFALIGIV